RYAELSIDLAERGLIAISGPNESGKSSIGETVCFALFGRTFSVPPEELEKVIRWGENECSVTLEFSVKDAAYSLSRFLDLDGNHGAKLCRAEALDKPVARGVDKVADALFGILGFAYPEFVESLYLAQREITTPHPHSHAVRIMAGIAPLESVSATFAGEITEREELLGELSAQWESVDTEIKALGIREGYLPALEDRHYRVAQRRDRLAGLVDSIRDGIRISQRNDGEIALAKASRGRYTVFLLLLLALGLLAAGTWALLFYAPESPNGMAVAQWLANNVPGWSEEKVSWVGFIAIGLDAVVLLLLLLVARVNDRIQGMRAEASSLSTVLGQAREITADDLQTDEADEREESEEDVVNEIPDVAVERPSSDDSWSLRRLLDRGKPASRFAEDIGGREAAWLQAHVDRFDERLAVLDDEIAKEQLRVQEAMDLVDVLNGLTDKREDVEERILDRRLGRELIAGAIVHFSNKFNRDVKDLVGRMLPRFTDGRYEHMKIDQDLKVRVFSNDKRNFMDLEEVSSGTQRQIMLAVRLALTKKLLSRTAKGKQFAFLDEPFAFFDEERTRRALHALADIGDDISQVWIVAQDFPADCEEQFDTRLVCNRDSDTLIVST
ncbi:MAG: AAA family ATPase, partial [Gammaproteobacteria bacterium]|nr:AAA family ATPase [Gammaproteobacteria bacterium]